MKNILILSETYSAGVKTYIDTILKNKSEFKNINFYTLFSSKRLVIDEPIIEKPVFDDNLSFGKSPIKLFKSLKHIHAIVKKHQIDVIHANSTFAGILIYLYSFMNSKISFIYTPHGYYSLKSMSKMKRRIVQFFEKKVNRVCDKVIHVSHTEESFALENHLLKKNKSTVIYNGVEDPKCPKKLRGILTVVNLARVEDQKNPFAFIEIGEKVLKKVPQVQFVWAGDGKLIEDCRKMITKKGLEKSIHFIGFAKKDQFLKQADVFLSTSFYEGLPFSVVEAMSYKVPLILSDVVGHRELIPPKKKNIYMYSLNDLEKAKEMLIDILTNSKRNEEASIEFYNLFNELFSDQKMIECLKDIYIGGN